MTPADFRAITHVLPEGCLLVTAGGEVLGANPAAERLIGRSRSDIEGTPLSDLVADDPDHVRDYLAAASRTRGPISGALTFPGDDDEIPCSCLGGLVEPADDDRPALLMVQLKARGSATNRFRLLDDQVDRLTREVRRRNEAERKLSALLEEENASRNELERRTAELERATVRLERNRALLEESQRSAHVGSWEWEVGTGELTWSAELYRIYGIDPAEVEVTFDLLDALTHPDDRERVQATLNEALESAAPFSIEQRIIRADGTVRVIQGRGRVVTDDDGTVIRMIGSGQDITERKRVEDRARFLAEAAHVLTSSLDYQETLRRVAELAVPRIADWAAVDVLQDGELRRLAITHPDPDKLALAEEAARRWPTDPDEPHGVAQVQRTGEPLLLPEISDSLLEELAQSDEHLAILRRLGLRSAMIVAMQARDQTSGSIAFIASESGRTFGEDDLAFAQQLADTAALAVDNARLYEEAREASRARDDLLAIVSHDLRSPLNAVMAGASLLMDVPMSEEKREEQYRAIRRSAERMERLTRDLLDITRIEAGHLRVEPKAEDARSLIEEALEAATYAAGRTGIFLSSDVQDDLPPVRADRPRILQVLDNLLSNAVRHTPDGGRVTLAARASGDELRFRVTNTGAAIPPELRDHIFDRYYQGEQSDHGGAGLGLPIAKGLVDAHGGRIWVEDAGDEGSSRGTTFAFTLPAASPHDENGSAVA